ncbi:ParB family protein [uncultured Shewanella sp.]|uniref:ParB family protein n=1 Tax=uncultured Shewanella sp. TaxID=173975 RepID=UPI00261869B2|nr:ParB family protein [uncultured Shewanella sp.]
MSESLLEKKERLKKERLEKESRVNLDKKNTPLIRKFKLASGTTVEAIYELVPANLITNKTHIHPLNPRNQDALNDTTLQDILESIAKNGVTTEIIAIRDKNEKLSIIEGSRRRFCCIKSKTDLPAWVLPDVLTYEDIKELIQASQTSKRFSYREVGLDYLRQMEDNGFTTNEELAKKLKTSVETIRKRIQAAKINKAILELFPDYEGIPNTFYTKLAKIEKTLIKSNTDVHAFCHLVTQLIELNSSDTISNKQQNVMKVIKLTLEKETNSKKEPQWNTKNFTTFEDKNKYARVSKNKDGRLVKMEFSRLSVDVIDQIENEIQRILVTAQ